LAAVHPGAEAKAKSQMIRTLVIALIVAAALVAADERWFSGRFTQAALSMLRQMRHAFGF
jgi:hypothetical protein